MWTTIGLAAVLVTSLLNGVDGDFISRVENRALLDSAGRPVPRIERDGEGSVTKLRLSGMQLSADDIAAIGRLGTLRFLYLDRTNVTDADLRGIRDLPHLEGLNLTTTEISDEAIDEITKFAALRSVCLGNVAVSPEAVARLKEHFRTHHRRLSLGYFRRR